MRRLLFFLFAFFWVQSVLAEAPSAGPFAGFVHNKGQWLDNILYSTELPQGWLFLEKKGFTYNFLESAYFDLEHEEKGEQSFRGHSVKVELVGANAHATISSHQTLPEYRNYFLGADPAQWVSRVPSAREIRYAGIFPRIDLKFYATGGKLKYDFVVQPGGQVAAIKMNYQGVDQVSLRNGRLWVQTSVNEFTEETPYAYQLVNGVERPVACAFTLNGKEVGFAVTGAVDPRLPLVIDPEVVFVTYTGTRTGASSNGATADQAGNTYAAGQMMGTLYPVTPGAYQTTRKGANTVISKFNSTGTRLLYATYLGGNRGEYPLAMLVTNASELVIAGTTFSPDFPTSATAYDKVLGTGNFNSPADFYITKLSEDGTTLLASTLIGGVSSEGSGSAIPLGLATDKEGSLIIASSSFSPDFPQVKAIQLAGRGYTGVIAKFNGSLSTLLFSSYLGGLGTDHITDLKVGTTSGHLYLVGNTTSQDLVTTEGALHRRPLGGKDGFLMVVDPTQGKLVAGTYLGTAAQDLAQLVTLDKEENVYVAGYTSGRYPATAGTYQTPEGNGGHFLHKLNKSCTITAFSTHLGNSQPPQPGQPQFTAEKIPTAFEVDACGSIFLSAYSLSGSPLTGNALNRGQLNLYLCQLSRNAQRLEYGSFFGSSQLNHVHFANKGLITKNGQLHHNECSSVKTLSPTPGAYSGSMATNFEGIITKFEFGPGSTSGNPEAPNIITPNADGKNDFFVIKNRGENAHLEIYNRWGKLVFKTDRYQDEWDGKDLSEGTYFYVFDGPGACQPLKGWVEIVR
ncbi:gliding motility-associated C-terminal domain-containing protein [Rufibacter tibetensis]|uniref:DUF7948 domain-containing protein n=1 Tax=Rufibacter tibetensis TaxID=512763 RepID=A0A0N7HVZ1_9BACT|nr:gliding motility-associated C-terminal domain-containing protein [Rufibacter tibetensis]ALI97792.1 hypothetical protein DC20_00795 [Rufibacter tibetensis]